MNYTSIEQSKKLLELGLSPKSADMCYLNDGTAAKVDANSYNIAVQLWKDYYVEITPCWSVGALLEVMPATIQTKESTEPYTLMLFKRAQTADEGDFYEVEYGYRQPVTVGWLNAWYETKGGTELVTVLYDMVIWLLEKYKMKGE